MHGLAIVSFAAAASANLLALPQVKRDLVARQTDSPALPTGTCATVALSLLETLPTPPPAIVSDIATNPQTDPCTFSAPDSLTSVYSSYSSELLSWVSSNEGALSSALGSCPELAQYASAVPVCSSALPGLANANTTTAAVPSKTPSSGGAAASTTPAEGGASRESGVAMFALAAAGLVAMAL